MIVQPGQTNAGSPKTTKALKARCKALKNGCRAMLDVQEGQDRHRDLISSGFVMAKWDSISVVELCSKLVHKENE